MEGHLALVDFQRLGHQGHRHGLLLVAAVDVPVAVALDHGGVDRLELEVQHAGRGVGGIDQRHVLGGRGLLEGRRHLADIDEQGAVVTARRLGQTAAFIEDIGLGDRDAGAVFPFNLQRIGGAHGGGKVVGDHRQPALAQARGVLQTDGLAIAGDRLGRAVIDGGGAGAETGRRQHRAGIEHPTDLGVDAEDGLAGGLGGDVLGPAGGAQHAALGGRLELDGFKLFGAVAARQGAAGNDLAVADALVAADDLTVTGLAVGGVDLEQARTCFDQRLASGGAGTGQRQEAVVHRPATPGDHVTPLGVAVDVFDGDRRRVDLEFLGHQAGQAGAHVLAHLGLGAVQGDVTLGVDGVPQGRLEATLGQGLAGRVGGAEGHAGQAKGENRAGAQGADQKAAAAKAGACVSVGRGRIAADCGSAPMGRQGVIKPAHGGAPRRWYGFRCGQQ